ncbi:MAG TPA: HAD family hydrolase [Gammaproteobacteria bacterium]|nr:HAD family hydrolase [Gammaproteobacteria bacterium]
MIEMDAAERNVLLERIRALSRPLQPEPTGYPPRLQPLADIRAVIFDIYGTLLVSGSGDVGPASEEENEQALREALAAAGVLDSGALPEAPLGPLLLEAIHAAQEERRREGIEYPEVDIVEVWRRLLTRLVGEGVAVEADLARLRRLAIEYECRSNPVWPMPGMRETLQVLKDRGIRLGIVSNAQFYTPLMLEALLDADPEALGFEPSLCSWSWRLLEAKPSTALFQPVLEQLAAADIEAAQTLYVGNDQLKDIWPASRLGWRTALFAGDRRSLRLREDDERCAGVMPELVIESLDQLAGSLD